MHAFVEFGNRLVGGVVITVTLLTWLAARKTPGLPDWARKLALAVLLGALAQAPLGYLAVASDLRWPVVMAHLLLSIALIAGAVVIAVEARRPARRAGAEPIVPLELRRLAILFTAAGFALVVSGTFATAAGPHSGGGAHIDRFGSLQPTVYVHGVFVGFFLISFLLSIGYLAAYRERSPKLFRLALLTLGLLIVQMGVGELQWRTKLPVGARARPRSARGGRLGGHRHAGCAVLPATSFSAAREHLDSRTVSEELLVSSRPELERPILIAAFRGWNDGGQGASLATGYLAKLWNARRFAEIEPENFFDFQATTAARLARGRGHSTHRLALDRLLPRAAARPRPGRRAAARDRAESPLAHVHRS